jgi:aminoglycoside 2'-N-acetyltransferase I
MIQELIFPQKEIPPYLKIQILSFLRIMWPKGFVGKFRLRDWISAEDVHGFSILLVENNILISHTEVVWKYLDHAGKTYKAYGLSGVFTYPDFQRQGYGKRLVRKGTEYIDQSDADIGMFHCDKKLKDFYKDFGWIPMETAVTYIGDKNHPVISDELLMMRFLSAHGKQGRPDFENTPFYFGEDTW